MQPHLSAYLERKVRDVIADEVETGKIRTWSGQYVDVTCPTDDAIRIDDIAHALSLICRYTGHTDELYSVGDHSLVVYQRLAAVKAPPIVQLLGLLHDAEEAYMCDLASPIKKRYPDYCMDAHNLRGFIFDKYVPGWDAFPMYMDLVHRADQEAYQMERISFLFPWDVANKEMGERFNRNPIIPRHTKSVEQMFLQTFRTLTNVTVSQQG